MIQTVIRAGFYLAAAFVLCLALLINFPPLPPCTAASASAVAIGRIPAGTQVTVRVGLRYGPSAADSAVVGATEGGLILESIGFSDKVHSAAKSVTLRVVAADSRLQRTYRLNVGEYTDPLGAEKRLTELSMQLESPVEKTVRVVGNRFVAYLGNSSVQSEMYELRDSLGLSSSDAEVEALDLPAGMVLEVAYGDGSRTIQIDAGYVVIRPDAGRGVLYLDNPSSSYRGSIEARVTYDGKLELVNIVGIEDYLRSAVGSEMNGSAPIEALKAQAVLMRTYVINHMAASKHNGFDVCDNHHCQSYLGVRAESGQIDLAVRATSGEILVDEAGKPVQVYYHACCGGITESSVNAWGAALPHLVSVPCSNGKPSDLSDESAASAFIKSSGAHYCSESQNYRWIRHLSRTDILNIAKSLDASIGDAGFDTDQEVSLAVVRRTEAGRVAQIEVRVGARRILISGDLEVRMALGLGDLLPSSFFVVVPSEDCYTYTLLGAGYGHGVGMCQAGAIGMAKKGYDYRDILFHYFSPVSTGDD